MPDEVRTERLVLHRIRETDLPALVAVHCDPEAHPHDEVRSPEEAAALLPKFVRDWTEQGFGYWTVRVAGEPGTIGFGGIKHHDLDGEHVLNLYFRFRHSAWGHGYATEMARAAVDWAGEHCPELPIVMITNPGNTAAIKVAEKLGFALSGYTDRASQPCPVYRRQVGT